MAGELGVGAGQVENEVEMMKLKPFRKEKKKTDTTVVFSSKNFFFSVHKHACQALLGELIWGSQSLTKHSQNFSTDFG